MKINFKLVFDIILLVFVYCGLFIYDIIIILLFKNFLLFKFFDISDCKGKCIYIEECLSRLFGLCYFRENESLNEIFVFFENFVVFYWIDIENGVKFFKL